jgi:hypothetical protein
MNVSKRTKLSLVQFLELFDVETKNIILEKYDISYKNDSVPLKDVILQVDIQTKIADIIEEVVQKNLSLKKKISPKYIFEEHFRDLTKCLLLDGFKVEDKEISKIEPFIEANAPIEDDLTKLITESSLPQAKQIIEHIKRSAQLFLQLILRTVLKRHNPEVTKLLIR